MSEQPIVPCLWLDHQAEEAASFYTRAFPDARVTATSHYPKSRDNPSGRPRGSVLTVEVVLAGQRFTLLNGGPHFVMNPSISFFVEVESPESAERLFAELSAGGEALMPLGAYAWSERYGWVKDRFGASWQVMAVPGRKGAGIVPCLMFSGKNRGKAEAALEQYASIFPGGRVTRIERYAADEGLPGAVKHGRVALGERELVAMDSHIDHGVTFDEGISLQVLCRDQGEVDRFWKELSAGGEEGPCGWLKDRFGVSWQVVPADVVEWMASPDEAGRDRAFSAMLGMKKLDISALRAAFDQKGG